MTAGAGEPSVAVPTRRRSVRPWVPAVVLFVGGFAGRLVIEASGAEATAAMYAVALQCWTFGCGLLILAGWWLRRADVGRRGAAGCLGWLVLAAVAAAITLSSSHH